MYNINKWICILVTVFVLTPVVFLSGCTGAFLASPEKQEAYNDYIIKSQKLGDSVDRLEQLNKSICDILQDINYDFDNTAEAYTALGKITASTDIFIDELDVFITDCDNVIYASQKYRTYLNPDSSEYKQLLNNETYLTNIVQDAKKLKELCVSMKSLFAETNTWAQKADDLVNKIEEGMSLTTGPEFYTWLTATRPALDGYITESNILISMTNDTIELAQINNMSDDDIVSLQQFKNTIISGNSEIVSSYNTIVELYNSKYGSAFGYVSKA